MDGWFLVRILSIKTTHSHSHRSMLKCMYRHVCVVSSELERRLSVHLLVSTLRPSYPPILLIEAVKARFARRAAAAPTATRVMCCC